MPDDSLAQLGISRRPYFDYFGNGGGGTLKYKEAAQQDKLLALQQQQIDAEAAAAEFYQQPTPSARQTFLEDNPQIAASQQFGDILRYQDATARKPTTADQTLRRSYAMKLPPNLVQRFNEQVDSGVPVNDAFDLTRMEDEDLQLELKLIDAGIHPDKVAEHRDPTTGFIDPRKAVFAMRQAAEGAKVKRTSDPQMAALDDYYGLLKERIARKELTAEDTKEDKLELAQIEDRRAAKLKALLDGAPAPVVVDPGVSTTVLPVADAAVVPAAKVEAPVAVKPIPAEVSYADIPAYLESLNKSNALTQERDKIGAQWTQQKKDLEKTLASVVPDKPFPGTDTSQLEAFARAIVNEDEVLVPGDTPGMDGYMAPAWRPVLDKLGINWRDKAFAEQGNQRTGSQIVGYPELLKNWAHDFLDQRGKLLTKKESPTNSTLTPEQDAGMQKLKAAVRPTP